LRIWPDFKTIPHLRRRLSCVGADETVVESGWPSPLLPNPLTTSDVTAQPETEISIGAFSA